MGKDNRSSIILPALRVFMVLLVMGMLSVQAVPAAAEGSGPITGKFGLNAAPSITEVVVNYANTTITPPALTPMQTYDIRVSVTDNNGVGDLDKVVLKLYYDSTGANYGEDGFNAFTTADANDGEIITWTKSTNQVTFDESWENWDGNWRASLLLAPTAEQLANPDITSYRFEFRVTIGMVSRQTVLSGDRWQVVAQASDSAANIGIGHHEGSSVAGLPMNWYGAIFFYGGADNVNWGKIQPGMRFTDSNSRRRINNDNGPFVYFCNGNYLEQVKSAKKWTNTGDNTKYMTLTTDATASDTIALKAALTANLEDSLALKANGEYSPLMQTGTITGMYGHYEFYNNLWLAVSSTLVNSGIYSGYVYYGIANR